MADECVLETAEKAADVPNRIRTEEESDAGYQIVARRIIDVSKEHLAGQQASKVYLRKGFAAIFSLLIIFQCIFAVVFILMDSFTTVPFHMAEGVFQLYITSVFVETLSTMGAMIAFAFASKEETRIVGLLNRIIENYQKVDLDPQPAKEKDAERESPAASDTEK